MKRLVTLMFVLALVVLGLSTGCNDGQHVSRPYWTNVPNINSQVSDELITVECVNVVNYEDIEIAGEESPVEESPPIEETTPDELTEGEVTTESMSFKSSDMHPVGYLPYLLGGDNPAGISDETEEFQKCIESEIEELQSSGTEYYWQNFTWILLRKKGTKKPKPSQVRIIDLESCSQAQAADCLLID